MKVEEILASYPASHWDKEFELMIGLGFTWEYRARQLRRSADVCRISLCRTGKFSLHELES
jgi:hypothetical protein